MRKLRIAALLVCAVMALPAASCGTKKSSSSSNKRTVADGGDPPQAQEATNVYQSNDEIGKNEKVVNVNEQADMNDTGFTLNRAIVVNPDNGAEGKYVYLDVVIKNDTDKEYELSTLNNFYLIYPDGSEKYGDIQTELYGTSKLKDFWSSPFAIKANSEFKGVVGGFVVDKDVNEFTVGFFPTLDNARDKEDVVKVKVDASNIAIDPADILK